MAVNYKSCPLKKRPFVYVEELPQTEALALTKSSQFAPEQHPVQQEEQPQDLSLKRKASAVDFEDYELPAKREYVLNLSKTPMTPSRRALSSALLSPPAEEKQEDCHPTEIHMRGLTAATAGYTTNPYQSAFVMAAGCNPISALWSNYQPHLNTAAFPSPASSLASPHSVYSYQQMTPPSSPGSDVGSSCSEPEDLSVRNDIPLPALFHLFDEARSSGHSGHSGLTPSSCSSGYSYAASSSSSSNSSCSGNSSAAKNYRYKCDNCQKMYSTSMGLSKHRQFHCPAAECNQEKRQHACEECGKLYNTIGALKMHIRTHTLPCKCPICGKAFSRPWLLQGHIRTHTGEKPFQCPDCPRSFADRSNLRAHQQTHVDVKKYACQVCHKSFSRMSLLNKHASSNCTITIV
ncbi:hypothetical protein ACLKA7_004587 [Drosophila subpalustris]